MVNNLLNRRVKSINAKSILMALCLIVSVNFYAQENSKNEEEENEQSTQCGGTERWSVKVLVDNAVNTINFTPVTQTISQLVNITTPTPSSTMPRYPGVEDKTYSVTCRITIKKVETDNDYHLVLSDGTNTMIGEIPDPTCSAAAGSAYVNDYIAARNFINAHIASGNVSSVNIPAVTVYGVAFVDPPHGQTGAAPNNLELHPILGIQFANTTDVKNSTEIVQVNIYPNPATNNLNVQINSEIDKLNDCEFRIFNTLGALIKSVDLPKTGNSSTFSISLDGLNAGLYYYRITRKDRPFYEGKFIKN